MKKLICIFFCLLILTAPAFAGEYLQVDAAAVDGVKYFPSSGAIVPVNHDFTFYALVDLKNHPNDPLKSETINDLAGREFHISIALIPSVQEDSSDVFDYGSFEFNGETYEVNNENPNLQYGTLPSVDGLTTYYIDYSFDFANGSASNSSYLFESGTAEYYTSRENWGANLVPVDNGTLTTSDTLAYAAFNVQIYNLNPEFDIRFDLYTIDSLGNITDTSSTTHYVQTAPEPGTMMLFGFGLIWMARMGRKKLL